MAQVGSYVCGQELLWIVKLGFTNKAGNSAHCALKMLTKLL